MNRYLFRVQYVYDDGAVSYEPHCIRADTEADAREELDAATERYPAAVGATKVVTLTLVTADV